MKKALTLAHELEVVSWSDAQTEAAEMIRKQDAAIKTLREALEMIDDNRQGGIVRMLCRNALAATEEFNL
jgi:hypothetical protein